MQFLHGKLWIFGGTRVAKATLCLQTLLLFVLVSRFNPTANTIKSSEKAIGFAFLPCSSFFFVCWHPVKNILFSIWALWLKINNAVGKVDGNNIFWSKLNVIEREKHSKKTTSNVIEENEISTNTAQNKVEKKGISGCFSMFIDEKHTQAARIEPFANLHTTTKPSAHHNQRLGLTSYLFCISVIRILEFDPAQFEFQFDCLSNWPKKAWFLFVQIDKNDKRS